MFLNQGSLALLRFVRAKNGTSGLLTNLLIMEVQTHCAWYILGTFKIQNIYFLCFFDNSTYAKFVVGLNLTKFIETPLSGPTLSLGMDKHIFCFKFF